MESRTTISRMLARNLLNLQFKDLPSAAVEKAKICIYDSFSSVLGGCDMPVSLAAIEVSKRMNGNSESSIWMDGGKTSLPDAAFANTALAHSLLQEDTHIISQSHPGSVVIPSVFTLGEKVGARGKDAITAIVAGYEAMTRVGRFMVTDEFNRRGFRPSGVFGTFGSCIVAARMLGLSEDQTCNAFGIAGNCSAGVMEFANAGTRDFPLHNAFAVRNGILAAYLARHGATGPQAIFEGKAGIGNAFSGTRAGLEGIGSIDMNALEIMEVYFKAYPTCGFVQTTPTAALRIRNELKLKPEEIEEITVGIFTMGKIWPGTDFSGPFEEFTQAQMSNQFVLAAALVDGKITPATLHNRMDPRYAEVANKVKVEIDPDCDKNYPPKESVKLTVRTKNGKSYTIYEDDLFVPDDKFVVDRFVSYGKGILKDETISALVEQIEHLERVKNIGEMTSLLVKVKK